MKQCFGKLYINREINDKQWFIEGFCRGKYCSKYLKCEGRLAFTKLNVNLRELKKKRKNQI
ncbi:MAG: hypothetical protein IJH34_04620 [Romboutsia sp.]|nr:hypothetical protein [Romboutsia sp.]